MGGGIRESQKDDSYQYRDSLNTILVNIIQIFIFGEEGLKSWWTPASWKKSAQAIDIFRRYITRLIAEERDNVAIVSGRALVQEVPLGIIKEATTVSINSSVLHA